MLLVRVSLRVLAGKYTVHVRQRVQKPQMETLRLAVDGHTASGLS